MDVQYLKIDATRLVDFTPESHDAIAGREPVWISIFTEDRSAIVEHLGEVVQDELAARHVLDPGNSTRLRFTEQWAILDFNTVLETQPVETEYITLLIKEGIFITIADRARSNIEEMIAQLKTLPLPGDEGFMHVVYIIFHQLTTENLDAIAIARKQVDKLAETINERPKEVELSDIMDIKRDLGAIAGVIEDEYYSIGFLPELRLRSGAARYRKLIAETARGLEHLKNSVERIEDRLESIQRQYELTLQDLFNKRLSTLTILQAIFVPLTLIAGIYGMNFAIMPELKFEHGYFWVLGLMALIAGCELLYFYKKGWFK